MGLRTALATLGLLLLLPRPAAGEDTEGVYLRVLTEAAPLRSGPGFSYRVLAIATRGDVFRAAERSTRGYWFRIVRPDGTYAWILGDMVQPFEYDEDASPDRGFLPWLFAPSPLVDANAEVSFSAGVLGRNGLFLLRAAWVIAPEVSLEGHLGETAAADHTILVYGLGVSIHLWPRGFLVPFAHLATGGAATSPDIDVFTAKKERFGSVQAGGGFKIAFQKRVTLRFDYRHHVLYDPNFEEAQEEFTGGLSVFF